MVYLIRLYLDLFHVQTIWEKGEFHKEAKNSPLIYYFPSITRTVLSTFYGGVL